MLIWNNPIDLELINNLDAEVYEQLIWFSYRIYLGH